MGNEHLVGLKKRKLGRGDLLEDDSTPFSVENSARVGESHF